MDQNKTAIERAFELGWSGQYTQVSDLKNAVSREGYLASQLEGPSLTKQLRKMIRVAKLAAAADP